MQFKHGIHCATPVGLSRKDDLGPVALSRQDELERHIILRKMARPEATASEQHQGRHAASALVRREHLHEKKHKWVLELSKFSEFT